MPLRVVCPEGCRFTAPTRQAGRQVRCPRCRTVLRIPALDEAQEPTGERLIILKAERVADSKPERPGPTASSATSEPPAPPPRKTRPSAAPPVPPPVATAASSPRSKTDSAAPVDPPRVPNHEITEPLSSDASADAPIEQSGRDRDATSSSANVALTDSVRAESREEVPEVPAHEEPRAAQGARDFELDRPSDAEVGKDEPAHSLVGNVSEVVPIGRPHFSLTSATSPEATSATFDFDTSRLAVFERRRHQEVFKTSRKSVCRIIAFCILLVGVSNVLLGAWLSGWLTNPATAQLRTWAVVLIFLGALHAAYAAYLAQIADWSAHWVAATFLLVIASISAGAAVLLGMASAEHAVVRWLELPRLLQLKGAIWMTCMVLMSASLAWWSGREALYWRGTMARLQTSTAEDASP